MSVLFVFCGRDIFFVVFLFVILNVFQSYAWMSNSKDNSWVRYIHLRINILRKCIDLPCWEKKFSQHGSPRRALNVKKSRM